MKGLRFLGGLVAAAALAVGTMGPGVARAQTIQFSSGIQVQNLSSSTANISISFYPINTATPLTPPVEASIPANGQQVYATLPSAVTAGFDGSAVISSDQRIAATVNIVSPDLSLTFGGETYVGVTAGSPTVRLPLLFRRVSGFSTFVAVQNVGTANANVTLTYQNGATQTASNVPPGASVRFDQTTATGLPDGFVGAATVTATGSDIAAVVTQVGPTTMLIYNGFSTTGSTAPVFPLVNANNSGFITGITIQNAGTAATNVTVSYSPSRNSQGNLEGAACTETLAIQPQQSVNFAVDAFRVTRTGEDCRDGALFVGSGRVTANSANQPLVAIVNQLNGGANKGGSYAAFDTGPATDTVVYPLVQDRVSGFFTGLAIYNAGTVATNVECTYTNTQVKQSTTTPLQPGETFSIVQNNVIGQTYTGAGTCKATAAGAKIVGTANQLRVTGTADTFFVYEGITN